MAQLITIKVLPRSSRDEIMRLSDGSYKVKMTAAPVGGSANKKLIKLLSRKFGIAKSGIEIVKGIKSKEKLVKLQTND